MSIRICKTLLNRQVFSILNKSCRLKSSKLLSQKAHENVRGQTDFSQNVNPNQFFTKEDRQCCRNFMENQTSLPVQWETLEQTLSEINSKSISSTILRSCHVLKKEDLAIDYCQHIINKGKELSLVETCLLIRMLAKSKHLIEKYDKLIKTVFDQFHDTILSIEIIAVQAMEVFCQIDNCFRELLLKYERGELQNSGIGKLVERAFDVNEPELAWSIVNEYPEKFSPAVVESYLKFCIRLAEQNKFSIDRINDLVNFTKTNIMVAKCNGFENYIEQLTVALNKNESEEYLWSVDKCNIVESTKCSSCQYKFKPETVTKEELKELKKNFLKKVIVSYNINMKTTPKELQTFMDYLNNCEPYDIVIDALNLLIGPHFRKEFGGKILSHLKKRGMRILLIGRNHFKYFELYKQIKQKLQIFLTRNDSLDDLFCLYAAMHQGVNTYFCSSDFLRDHAKYFDDYHLKPLFRKWQISHQYMLNLSEKKLLEPRFHSDMSQSSIILNKNNEVEEYRWHLSYLKSNEHFCIETPASWICLRAKLKTNQFKREEP